MKYIDRSFYDDILALDYQLQEVLRNSDNKQTIAKRGIEIHGKLEKAKQQLDAMEKVGYDLPSSWTVSVDTVRRQLLSTTNQLLIRVFRIDPTKVAATPAAPTQQKETTQVDNTVRVRTNQINEINVEIENEVVTGDVVAVVLRAKINGDFRTFTGSAKRSRDDKFDAETGLYLAYGRAFGKISKQLLRQGNGLVNHQANQRASAARKRVAKAAEVKAAEQKRQAQERAAKARAVLAEKRATKAVAKPTRTTAKRSTTTKTKTKTV